MYYDKEDIHRYVSAEQVAADILGVKIRNSRSAAEWRGGDGQNVEYYRDGTYYDFVEKKGGDAPMLLVAAGQARDYNEACTILGDKYCPQCGKEHGGGNGKANGRKREKPQIPEPPPIVVTAEPPIIEDAPQGESATDEETGLRLTPSTEMSKSEQLQNDGYRLVIVHTYTDENGTPILLVRRFENAEGKKQFEQVSPDGRAAGAQIQAIYNLPNVKLASRVFIVEGEKCADMLNDRGYCATTNPGGAEKWTAWHSEKMRGRHVVILGDNDKPGHIHGSMIANAISQYAVSVKLIFPSEIPKGDIVDWFGEGVKTNADFDAMVEAAPFYEMPRAGQVTPEMIATAKEANREPFRNFYFEQVVDSSGKPRQKEFPRQVNDMLVDLSNRLLGFPYRLNDKLFDWDKDAKEYKSLPDEHNLIAWISAKTRHNVEWQNGRGFVTKREFYEALYQNVRVFAALSSSPEVPMRSDVYYTYGEVPMIDKRHPTFTQLINFFCPYRTEDRTLLKMFFMTPMFAEFYDRKPFWVIESAAGQGVGKTTLVQMLGILYANVGEDIILKPKIKTLTEQPERIIQNIVSEGGRKKKIMLLDNLMGKVSCETLAEWITSVNFSDRAAYSREYGDRPNNLTYVATSNEATFDRDLQTRMFILTLDRHQPNANWAREIERFITNNRLQILFEIQDIIQSRKNYGYVSEGSRFAKFEEVVGMAACETEQEWKDVIAEIETRKRELNSEGEDALQAKRLIDAVIEEQRRMSEIRSVEFFWLTNKAIEVIATNGGERFTAAKLRAWARDSENPLYGIVNSEKRQYKRETGIAWSCDRREIRDGDYIAVIRKKDAISLEAERFTWGNNPNYD